MKIDYEKEVERLEDEITDWKQACVPNCHDYDCSNFSPATVDRFREKLVELMGEPEFDKFLGEL